MSTYVREKVLRIPFKKLFKRCSISDWFTSDDLDDMSWLLEKNSQMNLNMQQLVSFKHHQQKMSI